MYSLIIDFGIKKYELSLTIDIGLLHLYHLSVLPQKQHKIPLIVSRQISIANVSPNLTDAHVCMYVWCICIYVYVGVYVCIMYVCRYDVHMYTCIDDSTCTYVCACLWARECVRACVRTWLRTCMCVLSIRDNMLHVKHARDNNT